jgi:hypothetical protein
MTWCNIQSKDKPTVDRRSRLGHAACSQVFEESGYVLRTAVCGCTPAFTSLFGSTPLYGRMESHVFSLEFLDDDRVKKGNSHMVASFISLVGAAFGHPCNVAVIAAGELTMRYVVAAAQCQ